MLIHYLLAILTFRHIFSYVPLPPCPPIKFPQVPVHFGYTWMNWISRTMRLCQHCFNQVINSRETNSPSKSEHPSCAKCGIWSLPRHHLSPELVQILTLKLFSLDFWVLKAILGMSLGLIFNWWYPDLKFIFENTEAPYNWSKVSSMQGIRCLLRIVTLFNYL